MLMTAPRALGSFERERRPEQRHDPVAHHLIDEPVVLVDGRHHELEHRIEQSSSLFGVARGQELGRVLEIGEEHRHVLALALGHPGAPHALGEVRRRVLVRREGFGRVSLAQQKVTAVRAESSAGGIVLRAATADHACPSIT
jgi:hypothetical protein